MKQLLSVLMLLALASCGSGGGSPPKTIGGNNTGNGCTVMQVTGGAEITCDGETVFIPNGVNGQKGDKGDTGDTGSNVFADALAIHTSKRQSVFRLTVDCEYDMNGDGTFGDVIDADGNTVWYGHHTGSGFLVSGSKVASNKHVVADSSCDYSSVNSRVYRIEVEGVGPSLYGDNLFISSYDAVYRNELNLLKSSTYDLAKFSVSTTFSSSKNIFEIDHVNNGMLTPTLSMSFPRGIEDMITNIGEIVTDNVETFSGYDFMTSNNIEPGSSGSPIININTGKVIGIVTALFYTGSAENPVNASPAIVIDASRLDYLL